MKSIKIFVVGAYDAGTTEFIKSLSEINVISVEKEFLADEEDAISPAMDFGRRTIVESKQVIYFFGWPRCSFRPFDGVIREANLLIVVVDPTIKAIDRMEENILTTKSIIKLIQSKSLPYGIAISRRKNKERLSKDNIRILLELDETIPILECDPVTDPASAKQVLVELFNLLPQDDLVQAAIEKLKE